MTDFQREDRYIVLKIKHLSEEQLAAICQTIQDVDAVGAQSSWKSVVIESDWPIYNTAWDMVQRLAEGRPQELDELKAANVKAEAYCSLMNDAIQDFCNQFDIHDGGITQTDIDMLREFTFTLDNMKKKLRQVEFESVELGAKAMREKIYQAISQSPVKKVQQAAEQIKHNIEVPTFDEVTSWSEQERSEQVESLRPDHREAINKLELDTTHSQAPTSHELKTDPDVFNASWLGKRNYEIRYNDRDYQVGDTLILRETRFSGVEMQNGRPLIYTGREMDRIVTHILEGYGLDDGWVILSVEPLVAHE